MREWLKRCYRRAKLMWIWIIRIVGAPNHFHVPLWRRLYLNIRGGFIADQHVLYHLENPENRKKYLSEYDWYRSRDINEPFNAMLNNKIICTQVLQQYVKVPPIDVVRKDGVYSWFTPTPVQSEQDVLALLREKKALFLKPLNAGKGKGVYRLEYDGTQYRIDQDTCDEAKLIRFLKGEKNWFLSEAVTQHPFEATLYPYTTNTMRIITWRNIHTQEIEVFFAVQRIGTQKTIPVDNGSRGGLVANIDLATGRLSEARSLQDIAVHKVHPDSGSPIEGVCIPGWEGIREEVLALAKRFPYLHFIAWDILLTEEGIYVIEANTSSGVNIIQLWGGQRQGPLGDFYRHHKVIR